MSGGSRAAVPSGVVSVMPQAHMHGTPWRRSSPSISARGAAEPPMISHFSDETSWAPGSASRAASTPSQTVGTAAVIVTRSSATAASRLAGSRAGPGRTIRAPLIAQANGSPQAMTWNIGTTGSTVSASRTSKASPWTQTSAWITSARCE